MKKETKPKHFLHKPIYPGGVKAMKEFLSQAKKYPAEAKKQGIEGTVHIRYTIDHKGDVIKTHVISGIGHGCDEEAERIVGLLKFKVAKTRKVRTLFHKTIRIHFKIPKPVKRSFQYVTPAKQAPVVQAPKEKKYSYSITITQR